MFKCLGFRAPVFIELLEFQVRHSYGWDVSDPHNTATSSWDLMRVLGGL